MPIKSYLIHPVEGKKEVLTKALSQLDACEVIPAENRDVIILVTETATHEEEDRLKEKIEAIEGLKAMAMVSGFNTSK